MSTELMTCERVDALLADWLDGALDDATRRAIDAHIAGCTWCAGVVARLDEIPPRAAALPLLEPSHDLWAGLAPRLEAPVIALADRRPEPRTIAVQRRSWPARFAATAALMVATAGITWYSTMSMVDLSHRERVVVDNVVPAQGRGSVSLTKGLGDLEALTEIDVTYDREVAALQKIVRDRRGDLDPATLKMLQKNLAMINQAIAQSRAALRKDPNGFLAERLNSARDKKLRLLRTIAMLPSTT